MCFNILKRKLNQRFNLILHFLAEKHTSLNVKICNKKEIQNLNLRFRNKNSPTDVLSFPHENNALLHQEKKSSGTFLGDLAICFEICWENSKSFQSSFREEVEKMLIHGILHLKGFDHERSPQAHKIMTELEKSIQREVKTQFGNPQWIEYDVRECGEMRK